MKKMKTHSRDKLDADSKSKKRSCLCRIVPVVSLLCVVLLFSSSFFAQRYNEKLLRWKMNTKKLGNDNCKNQCRPGGNHALPEGIISNTSDLEMRHLWDLHMTKTIENKENTSTNLFAMAVGIKQKDLVNKMVKKFLVSNFVVMLFHYDGIVDEWNDFEWNNQVIHVAVANQSKWWFAKRFLHPDIVAEYGYIFLWDEDLGVEHFHPDRYVSIIKSEGLEISQPALDSEKSEVHHQITARGRRSNVHRRIYKSGVSGKRCDGSSTAPPCTGWVEMMAPVFSRAAWRCIWYMIQNDLIHAWGLDMQLGYCAQGDRTKNVGVVDAEYIVHYGHPTLGGLDVHEVSSRTKDHRVDVRRLSYRELQVFRKRWQKAVEEDECWVDPFQ
ncbi:hypothetical protein GLYMA_09G251500v4 [Glycine max]|uniref:Uncharacterized protein n=1 Tax=Glycine max TaxID=3847 RepID=K7LFY8_SOYBN|nr:uncharacterized protein LOC100814260 isoform X1 [Glycine max]XP_028179801.1 uncharacterized protein LOC114366950 isoform X3 [Glycine soja]KAH1044717.1 hypothetical protein GYH30_026127 [Glycine max]KRH40324.1 hypothetical protein GLYMA_09G251500v4 [Glycine max]|eukprot:XP_006587812.1 uncharacterized protein LOC100814260 isoform X1 [Glycine max]